MHFENACSRKMHFNIKITQLLRNPLYAKIFMITSFYFWCSQNREKNDILLLSWLRHKCDKGYKHFSSEGKDLHIIIYKYIVS
jgi:hypothetical protein